MCTISMVMEWGREQPREVWINPYWPQQFGDLLRRAKDYDRENGEPDCELDEKRQALKKIADELGIAIEFP